MQWYGIGHELLGISDSLYLSESGIYTVDLHNYCSQGRGTFELSHYPLSWTALCIPTDTFMCQNRPLFLDVRIWDHPTTYQWLDAPEEVSGLRLLSQVGEYE